MEKYWTKQFRNLVPYDSVYKFCEKHVILRGKSENVSPFWEAAKINFIAAATEEEGGHLKG